MTRKICLCWVGLFATNIAFSICVQAAPFPFSMIITLLWVASMVNIMVISYHRFSHVDEHNVKFLEGFNAFMEDARLRLSEGDSE